MRFNGYEWYIIADDSTAADAGTVTLFVKDPIGACRFNNDKSDGNKYSSSTIRCYLDGLTAEGGSFAGVADAIVGVDLKELRPQVTGAKFWLLSVLDVFPDDIPVNIRLCSKASDSEYTQYNWWWLRTPGTFDSTAVCLSGVSDYANIQGDVVFRKYGVRPALKLDLSKVSFSSESMTFSMKSEGHVHKEPAVVTKAPTAKALTYNGQVQELVTAGEASGGTMPYAVTKGTEAPEASAYTAMIPAKKSAGTYHVWYKAVGDADHRDSNTGRVKVVIKKLDLETCAITVKNLRHTGEALAPKVTVKTGKTVLKEDKDYKLTYSDSLIDPGKWQVKVTGKSSVYGSTDLDFKVYLPVITDFGLTSDVGQINVNWSQKARIGNCRIQISTKEDFSRKKTLKYTISEKNVKHTNSIKGLQEGKKYYVRIQTCKTVGDKTYYSGWSEAKSITTGTSTKKNAQVRLVEMTVGEVLDLNTLLSQEETEAVRSWSAANEETDTVSVSPEGVVTAMKAGEASVTATLKAGEAIEFAITVKENGIVLLDLGEGDLTLDLDDDVFGDALGEEETNLVIEEVGN